MSTSDLDQLRQRWQQAHHVVEPQLKLDVEVLRRNVLQRSRSAFSRHAIFLLLGLVGQGAVLVALLAFLGSHWDDAIYRFLATPMAALALWQVSVSLSRFWSLRKLDLSAPVAQVRSVLDRHRGRQLLVTRWIILSSVLLWLPMLLVLLKGLFDVDLIWHLHPSVLWVNALVGVVFLLVGELLLRWAARRWSGSPALHRLLVETAGYSWQRAEQTFDAQVEFEQTLQSEGAAVVVEQHRRRAELPLVVATPLRRLKRRLVLAACVYGVLIILTGIFNARHGGEVDFLLASVPLNFFWIAQMVAAIVHRHRLTRIDYAISASALRDQLLALAKTHHQVARITLWFSPLFVLLLTQVLGKVLLGANLLGTLRFAGLVALLSIVLLACFALSRPRLQTTLDAVAEWLLLGAGRLDRDLRERCI